MSSLSTLLVMKSGLPSWFTSATSMREVPLPVRKGEPAARLNPPRPSPRKTATPCSAPNAKSILPSRLPRSSEHHRIGVGAVDEEDWFAVCAGVAQLQHLAAEHHYGFVVGREFDVMCWH
jgi:hypothetical protein